MNPYQILVFVPTTKDTTTIVTIAADNAAASATTTSATFVAAVDYGRINKAFSGDIL